MIAEIRTDLNVKLNYRHLNIQLTQCYRNELLP